MASNQARWTDWNLVYRIGKDGENVLFKCIARDIVHAVELCQSNGPNRIIVNATRIDANAVLPDTDGDFTLGIDDSAWIGHKNLSVHVREKHGELRIDVYPRGRESDEALNAVAVPFDDAATAALIPSGGSTKDSKEFCEVLEAPVLRAHLSALEDPDLQRELETILAGQLAG